MACTLLLIGATSTGAGLDVVRLALFRGFQVHLITPDPTDFLGVFPPDLNIHAAPPTLNGVLECLRVNHIWPNLAADLAVLTTNDKYVVLAAEVAFELGIPGPNHHAVTRCRSKIRQKLVWQKSGICTPRFTPVPLNKREDFANLLLGHKYPLVIKPDRGSSSIGVRLCTDTAMGLTHLNALADELSYAPTNLRSELALIEDYLPGLEFCVELFDGRYAGILRKTVRDGYYFFESGYTSELGISTAYRDAVINACVAAAAITGITWGPAHIDCILIGDLPQVIEINTRIAGSFICELIYDCYGFDAVEALLNKATRTDFHFDLPTDQHGYAEVRFELENDSSPAADLIVSTRPLRIRRGVQLVPSRSRKSFVYRSDAKNIERPWRK